MTTVIQNKFDGGHAEDIRTFANDQCEYSKNFDIFSNPHYLIPYPDTAIQSITGGNALETYVISDVIEDPTFGIVGLGQKETASTLIKFLSKDATTTATWTQRAESATYTRVKNTLVSYKGLPFAMGVSGSDGQLLELTDASTITARGTVTGKTATCRPFVHPEDNVLYIGSGYIISKWDGSSFTNYTTIIPTTMNIISLTNYGTYLAIGCREASTGKSVIYLWGRDGTINTLQSVIDVGTGYLFGAFNVQDTLILIMTSGTAVSLTINPKLYLKVYEGGVVRTISELPSSVITEMEFAVGKEKIIFGSASTDSVYTVMRNKEGKWTLTKSMYFFNGADVGSVLSGISITSDILWVGFSSVAGTAGLLYSTKFSTASPSDDYTASCKYRTTINPNMPIADRYKDKQLEAVAISYTGASTGTTKLRYSVDGGILTGTANPDGTTTLAGTNTVFEDELIVGDEITINGESRVVTAIASDTSLTVDVAFTNTPASTISRMRLLISDTNAVGEITTEATNEAGGISLSNGREFQFQVESTGKSKIKEIKYKYSVLNTTI